MHVKMGERSYRGLRGWRGTEPNVVTTGLRHRACGLTPLDENQFRRGWEQATHKENCGVQIHAQRVTGLDDAPLQFRPCDSGAITQRMLNTDVSRTAQNGEKWVVQKKRDEHQAHSSPQSRLAVKPQSGMSPHRAHTITIDIRRRRVKQMRRNRNLESRLPGLGWAFFRRPLLVPK